jgi:hypothetical protein
MRTRNDVKLRGIGTGNHPASRKRRRCLSCGHWATAEGACISCGKDPVALPVRLDEPTKRCHKCGVDQPLSYFKRDPGCKDGLTPWCRPCSSRQVRERREHLRLIRDHEHCGIAPTWKKGQPGLSVSLEARVWRLLTAASKAATAGRWRGHEGLLAYRDLRCALDEWKAPETECVVTGEDSPILLEEA